MSYYTEKLTENQKLELKQFREEQKNFKVVDNGETTFVYREHGDTVEFVVSVAIPDNSPFRKKTGEYYARLDIEIYNTQDMLTDDFHYMLRDVFCIHTKD